MSVSEIEFDVDELRCELLEARNDLEGIADELALAVELGNVGEARRAAANLRQTQTRVRRLRTVLRVEEGCR